MARVALIQVRATGSYGRLEAAGPPLGLLSLASYARLHRPGRDEIRVWDAHFADYGTLAREVAAFAPALVGLSAANMLAGATRALAAELVRAGLRCPSVVGGPLATSFPDWCLTLDGVQGVVRGEGERPFLALLQQLEMDAPLAEAPGLSVPTAGGRTDNPCEKRVDDLDALADPAYDLVDFDLYQWSVSQGARFCLPPHRWAPIFTSRSCPYRCTFCHSIFGKGFRAQSAPRIVETVERLYREHGVANFHVYDDIFNLDRNRLRDFARRMARSPVPARFYFVNGLRADRMNRGDIEALAEAGTAFLSVAIESASERLQRKMKKFIDVERVLRTAERADAAGIFVNGFFMVGFPGETEEELKATFTAAAVSHLHHAWFFSFVPSPHTELGDALLADGVEIDPERIDSYLTLPWSARNLTAMSPEIYERTVRRGFRRFWTPWRLASFVARYPNLGEALLFASDHRAPLLVLEYARMRLRETDDLLFRTPLRRGRPSGWRTRLAGAGAPLVRGMARGLRAFTARPAGRTALPGNARGCARQRATEKPPTS